ncbi:MAG: hypothetical protein KGM97_10905, partial [Alphaproteobacteria bacterium]|nr:hypothetical protein [Alphaproteobacteria bacterium]
LCENFGSLEAAHVTVPADRRALIRALHSYGVWFGRRSIYLTKLLRPDAAALLALLWSVWAKLEQVPALPRPGLTSFVHDAPEGFLAAAGFRIVSGRAIRLDILERLEDVLDKGVIDGTAADALMPKLVSLLGCGNDDLRDIMAGLGWHNIDVAGGNTVWRRTGKRESLRRDGAVRKDSPFAGLAALIGGK